MGKVNINNITILSAIIQDHARKRRDGDIDTRQTLHYNLLGQRKRRLTNSEILVKKEHGIGIIEANPTRGCR